MKKLSKNKLQIARIKELEEQLQLTSIAADISMSLSDTTLEKGTVSLLKVLLDTCKVTEKLKGDLSAIKTKLLSESITVMNQ